MSVVSSDSQSFASLNPEERLKKYKEFLASLEREDAAEQHRHAGRPSGPQPKVTSARQESARTDSHDGHETASLKPCGAVSGRQKEPDTKTVEERNRVLLRVKQRAVESEIDEVRREKAQLERKLERGHIKQEAYQQELEQLVKRGQTLLRRRLDVAKELSEVVDD